MSARGDWAPGRPRAAAGAVEGGAGEAAAGRPGEAAAGRVGEAASRDEPASIQAGQNRDFGSEQLVRRIVTLAAGKAATDLVALEIGDLVGYTDYLIICSVRNERRARAVHDSVYETLKKEDGRLPASVEGAREGRWILMDYLDCVLHVFIPEMRDRYRLEALWGEAPRLELDLGSGLAAPGELQGDA